MAPFQQFITQRLQNRKEENSLRSLTTREGLIDFSSNDYLGLAQSESLFRLIQNKVEHLPHQNGATGSRLLSGNSSYTEQVEQTLAKIFNGEAALIFNSGYAANQGVLSSIPQKEDTIFYDELAHACIRDGARLSLATRFPFRHNDLNDLESKLKKATGNIFVAVESIYSMDGDTCPLEALVMLAEQYGATIILDEAHSTGIMGKNGAGLAVSLGLESRIPMRIYTFGKGMGVHGACVVGSKLLTDYLINFARTFIFTTAMAPHSVASIACAFEFLNANMHLQKELNQRIQFFIDETEKQKVNRLSSSTQIQGIIIPGNDRIKRISNHMKDEGFDVRPILSPTVAKGSERIRICLHTDNTEEHIQQFVQHLSKLQSYA